MLQMVSQFYTIATPCVVHGLVRYAYMIVWKWSYNSIFIFKFTKEDILIWVNNVNEHDSIVAYFETLQVHKNVLQCVQHAMHVASSVIQKYSILSDNMHYKVMRSYVMIPDNSI